MTGADIIGLILVYSIIAASLGAAMLLRRRGSSLDSRKVVHIGVGLFVLVWWVFSESWIMLVFFTVPFALILLAVMVLGDRLSGTCIGGLANDSGHRTGLFLYAVSITILVALLWDHWTAATIGVVAMTWGDGLGSVVGRRYGRHRIPNGKSLEGSLGVFAGTAVATCLVVLYYGWLISSGLYPTGSVDAAVPLWAVSLIAGAIAAVLEAVCPGQYDNLAIPLVTAGAMVALGL